MHVRTNTVCGQGLGDAVKDIIHLTGWDRLVDAYQEYTGQPCGCAERQEKLNQLNLMDLWNSGL